MGVWLPWWWTMGRAGRWLGVRSLASTRVCVCVWGRTLKAIAIIIEWGQANSGHSSAWKMKYFRVYFQLPPYLPKFLTGGKSTLMKKQAYYHNQYGLHACSSELHCAWNTRLHFFLWHKAQFQQSINSSCPVTTRRIPCGCSWRWMVQGNAAFLVAAVGSMCCWLCCWCSHLWGLRLSC